MSNRKAEVLNRYLYNLSQLGYKKDDEKVKLVIQEIENELGLIRHEEYKEQIVKDKNKVLVIAIKDFSGSMGHWEHSVTNEYYELALRVIKEKYLDVKEAFILHTTEADIVSKEDYFNGNMVNGGTIVSLGLKEALPLLETDREVIVLQFSDGDNFQPDNKFVMKLLKDHLLPKVKLFKYIEANAWNRHSTLLKEYKNIKQSNFSHLVIRTKDDALKGLRIGEELYSLKDEIEVEDEFPKRRIEK